MPDFFGMKIPIIADDKTAKGIKSAKKNVSGFESAAKKLGGALASAFAVEKIIAFGKASVKAFAEDQKSAALLANTMKNLGLAFAAPQMETFISQLSKSAGVADDVLRPAMQKLISQTGDYFKSQELLTQAIEISRGSGVDLTTVTQDLANAYVGNTKGLKKYNLGLTQAELKTMDFAEVQKKLNDQFKGSNAAYLKTYTGQLEVLKTAAGEAQETIGKGLVESLALLADDGTAQGLADSMQAFADSISDAIYGLGSLAAEFKKVSDATPSWLKDLVINPALLPGGLGAVTQLYSELTKYGDKQYNKTLENPSTLMFKNDMANLVLNSKKVKDEKKILDLTKKRLAEERKAALQKKQSSLFDLEKISLVAALQGDISKEEKLRLELQLALLTGNDALATKLSAQLAQSIDDTGKLAKDLKTLPDAKNPFEAWSAFLDTIIAKARLAASFGATGGSSQRDLVGLTPTVQSLVTGAVTGGAGSTSSGDVYITVNGSVLSEQDLVSAVQNGLNYNSLAGKRSDIGRIAGMFG